MIITMMTMMIKKERNTEKELMEIVRAVNSFGIHMGPRFWMVLERFLLYIIYEV